MKFIPILFSTPMVQAILDGRKTQTRRTLKEKSTALQWLNDGLTPEFICSQGNKSIKPYKVGDILWVKETHYAFGEWVKNGFTKKGKQKWKFVRVKATPYKYLDNKPTHLESSKFRGLGWYKRPSLFMPFDAANIFLKVKSVTVERLQDISEEDAKKEGVLQKKSANRGYVYMNYLSSNYGDIGSVESFETLWQYINGGQSWNDNPWVWVIEFERIEKPEKFK